MHESWPDLLLVIFGVLLLDRFHVHYQVNACLEEES